MGRLCIIPARGGSKRIPKKNIKSFLGKPIIAYSIETAIKSGLFDEIMVSTDNEEIADISRSYGAAVPFLRTDINATDFATTIDVLQEVELKYKQRRKVFNSICCIYPTAPLISVNHLHAGFNLLKESEFDSVIPTVAFSYPVWRGVSNNNGKIDFIWKDNLSKRSQDLEPVYHDAGQWYWFNPVKIGSQGLFTDNTGTIILGEMEVQDIDTESDWKLAELKFRLLHEF